MAFFTITEISYLLLCIFHDLVQPPPENIKQLKNKESIRINGVSSTHPSVVCRAPRFRKNC